MENLPLSHESGLDDAPIKIPAESGRQKFLGVLLTVISASSFGLMAIFTKYAYAAHLSLLTLLCLRFLLAAIVMWLIVLVTRQNPRVARKQLFALLGLGAVGYGLMSTFFFGAVKLIPASIAAILLYTYPAIVTVLSALLDKEPVTKYRAVSLVVATIGLVMVVGVAFGNLSVYGITLGELAAIVYSFYLVLSNRLLKGLDPVIVSTYVMTAAALVFLIVGWPSGAVNFTLGSSGWLAIAGITIVSTVIAILTCFQGMKILGPAKVSIISTIEPVVTTVAAFIFFGETLTGLQVMGGLLVLGAVFLVQRE